MTGERLQLRSYRLAFELERRIHRIDRFRIPVPYGLPLSAVAWWFGGVVAVLLVARAPVAGDLLGLLPWPVRLVLLPAAIARALCVAGSDGRPAWERWTARARLAMFGRRVVAFARRSPVSCIRLHDFRVGGDESGASLRPALIRGGGAVLIARPARGRRHRARVELTAGEDRWLAEPHALEMAADSKLEIKCARR